MSRKRKTKNRKKMMNRVPKPLEEVEIVVREVELGEATDRGVMDEGDLRDEAEKVEECVEADDVDLDDEGGEEKSAGEEGTSENGETCENEENHEGEQVDRGEKTEKRYGGGWLHRVNIYYPWLKFVVILAMAVLAAMGSYEVGRVIGGAIWETTGQESGEKVEMDHPEEAGQDAEIVDKPTEGDGGGSGEGTEGEATEKPGVEQSEAKPPTTTKPPVAVTVTGGEKLVALTFDDGPSATTTGRLLDILKSRGVKATFFVVGSMAQRAPDLVRREVAEGHEVGSHSTYHQDLSKLGAADLQAETAAMDRIFTEILGRKVEIMRPPYGAVSETMRGYLGKPMVYWSVDPLDWKYRDAATVRANVVGATFDGAVVLMHDIHASTVDAVAGIIDDLKAQGYEFLTLSELATARGVGLTSGVVYYHFKP